MEQIATRTTAAGTMTVPVTLVDLVGSDDGDDLDFDPERLGLTARPAPLEVPPGHQLRRRAQRDREGTV